jgi:hypothetical protein
MPIISRFYGIVIKLFFADHNPPHFHAVYGEHNAIYRIDNQDLIEGDLPNRAQNLVKEWAQLNKNELRKMWDNQEFHQLPPLQ